jgi:hypothetical protein
MVRRRCPYAIAVIRMKAASDDGETFVNKSDFYQLKFSEKKKTDRYNLDKVTMF